MSESVILCEGFHDRAFWDGWLWRDVAVARELESRLRLSGAWQIAEAVAA